MSDNKTIRLRTTPGESQNIQFKIEQEFDTIDFLSLSITQEEAYRNFCSDYGVVAGRVIANDGFGVENAKVSIFIPILDEDLENQKITSIYPYSTPSDLNSQGIRYNLLPNTGREFWYYQKIPDNQSPTSYLHDPNYTPLGTFDSSDPWLLAPPDVVTNPTPGYTVWRRKVKTSYGPKVPVGTFPNKSELLDNETLIEVYEKYYKFTTRTNQSGDYMLFGVPVGNKIVHMDVDFSDTGTGSLKVEDFLNQGVPESSFSEDGDFKSATNLNTLPQIESQDIAVDVIPFWGNLDQCEIGITRQDFNLIQEVKPSSILMFSCFGSLPTDFVRLGSGSSRYGRSGGSLTRDQFRSIQNQRSLGVKVYTKSDDSIYESVDEFEDGNVVLFIPMTKDRVITNELGQLVPSNDPDKGKPTTTDLFLTVHPLEDFPPQEIKKRLIGYGFKENKETPYRLKFDLNNLKPRIYTLGEYNKKDSSDKWNLTIINNSGTYTQHPEVNNNTDGDGTFIQGIRYGSLWFPRLRSGKNKSYIYDSLKVADSDVVSEHFPNVEGYYYIGLFNDGIIMDVTDVINLWDIFGGGLTSYSSKLDTYTQTQSYAPYGAELRNHTIPLRGGNENFQSLPFPETLNTDQQPWPDQLVTPSTAYGGRAIASNVGNIRSSWNYDENESSLPGRYCFYWGVSKNNSVLHELKRRLT